MACHRTLENGKTLWTLARCGVLLIDEVPRSRELVVIFRCFCSPSAWPAQLTASTNTDLDPELPLLTRHPEFLHAGRAVFLGWSTTLLGR